MTPSEKPAEALHKAFRILTTLTVLCSLVIVMLGVRWGLFTMLV